MSSQELQFINEGNDQSICESIIEEVMFLRKELQESENERGQLKKKLHDAKELINQMEGQLLFQCHYPLNDSMKAKETCVRNESVDDDSSSMNSSELSDSKETKKRKRVLSEQVLERWDFYSKHKDDPEILKPLLAKFNSVGIEKVPWHIVKKKTDELFIKTRLVE